MDKYLEESNNLFEELSKLEGDENLEDLYLIYLMALIQFAPWCYHQGQTCYHCLLPNL